MDMMRNDLCWCGSGKKYKKCHLAFDERLNGMKFNVFKGQVRPPKKIINNAVDIEAIRKSGVINDGALDLVAGMIQPGIDTGTLNDAAHGEPLGVENVKALKENLGWPEPDKSFNIPAEVYTHYQELAAKGAAAEEKWQALFADYAAKYPAEKKLWDKFHGRASSGNHR